MLTRLLLGLDATPSSTQAAALALGLAATHGATVEALAIIDTPWITRPMAVGIGGSAYKVATEVAELRRAHAEAQTALQAVLDQARQRGVTCEGRIVEGRPAEILAAAAIPADAIVLGHGAEFSGGAADRIGPSVRDILVHNPRPILLGPSTPVLGEPVLVAFDASLPSARALHMAALLGIGTGRRIVVLSADADQAVAAARAAPAEQLLRAHGGNVSDVLAIGSTADPAEIILNHVQSLRAGMVVMGAYGHTGLREKLFGSCTRALLHACPTALMVHH